MEGCMRWGVQIDLTLQKAQPLGLFFCKFPSKTPVQESLF